MSSSSSTGSPDPEPAPRRQLGLHLHRWQAIIAAVLAAIATVVAALIVGSDTHGSQGGTGERSHPASVSVTSWSETPVAPPPGKKRYEFVGTASNLPGDSEIHVIVQASPGAAPGKETLPERADAGEDSERGDAWLISPCADVLSNGTWKVSWILPEPPAAGTWIAIVIRTSTSPSGTESEGDQHSTEQPVSPAPTTGERTDGPTAGGPSGSATVPPPTWSKPPEATPTEEPTVPSEGPTGPLAEVADAGPEAPDVVASDDAPPPD